jgi:hypothetical protein
MLVASMSSCESLAGDIQRNRNIACLNVEIEFAKRSRDSSSTLDY